MKIILSEKQIKNIIKNSLINEDIDIDSNLDNLANAWKSFKDMTGDSFQVSSNFNNAQTPGGKALLSKVLSNTNYFYSDSVGKMLPVGTRSMHKCTSGPKTWYKNAGISIQFWNSINDGGKTAAFTSMQVNGQNVWTKIASTNGASINSFKANPGDICLEFPNKPTKHACMLCADGRWKSDFIQKTCWAYGSIGGVAEIWRCNFDLLAGGNVQTA